MKKQILYLVLGALTFISCEKVSEPHVTSFQLKTTDYFSGDSIPNVPFGLNGVYTTSYNFEATTNAYGRFDTLIVHDRETDFDCLLNYNSPFFLAKNSGQVKNGINTEVELQIIPYANFAYNFDCGGSGYLQNVKREILYPFVPETAVSASEAGQPQYIYSPVCSGYSNNQRVFSGTWIVTYEKKNSSSVSVPWVTYSDTVYVAPDENFVYTIVY